MYLARDNYTPGAQYGLVGLKDYKGLGSWQMGQNQFNWKLSVQRLAQVFWTRFAGKAEQSRMGQKQTSSRHSWVCPEPLAFLHLSPTGYLASQELGTDGPHTPGQFPIL